MAKGRHGETKAPVPRFDATSLDKLARQAMRHISTTQNHHILSRRDSLTDWLLRHCISPWSLELDAVQRALDEHHLSATDIMDYCIPAAASRMGQMWADDELPFTDVTLGTARLMELSKHLAADWQPRPPRRRNMLNIMVATPVEEQHLLGPQLLTNYLRREGHSVRLMLGASSMDLESFLRQEACDAVFISVGSYATLDSANRMVAGILNDPSAGPRVIMGGGILTEQQYTTIKTPVQWITNDISTALAGLKGSESARDLSLAQ